MTILNLESDGLHSVLLTLASIIVDQRNRPIPRDDLIALCVPHADYFDKDPASRVRKTLNRWIDLNLFREKEEGICLAVVPEKGESADTFCERLPTFCRRLALLKENGLPLWRDDGQTSEEGIGRTADLCRGLAWCLAQDIYSLPSSWAEINPITNAQVQAGKFIFLNDTRWNGLKPWARFLGFATGDNRFFFDPTPSVRSELDEVFGDNPVLRADEFVERLAIRLPVLDEGSYYSAVTEQLRPDKWTLPDAGRLSIALSFAIQRLKVQGVLRLEMRSDAGLQRTLAREGGRIWEHFTHIRREG